MKKRLLSTIIALALLCSCIIGSTVSVSAQTEPDSGTNGFLDRIKSDFDLVFDDEFDGDTLDTTKWQYDGDGVFRNSEAQLYANGPDDGNVYMEDGCVVLKAEKEERTSSSRNITKQYTSGEISTQGKGAWKYGYFEFRAKLPKGHNVFPAIWLMGYDYSISTCDWPHSGEIDIMEALGGDSDSSPNGTWTTLHHSRYGQSGSGSHVATGAGSFENKSDMTQEFHNYWIYWTDEIIMCGVDDGCFGMVDITKPELAQSFRNYEHWILFDLAMGPYGKEIKERPTDDWRFYIDYARVYQLENEDDYDNYKIIEAEDTITDNGSSKSWSQNMATHLFSGSGGVITSKFEGVENGTYDIYASYMAKATGKSGVFDSYINGESTGEQIDTLSSTGKERTEQGYLGRVTVNDDSTFELKLKKSSGQADSLSIDKYMLVKTADTTGAIVSDKDNNANLSDLIEVANSEEFYSAFNSLRPGGTVRLTEDITLTARYTFMNNVTIDLNGHTMDSGALNSAFYVSKSNIKIKFMNGKIIANGKNGVLDNFMIAANSWDQHYVTFEDIDVTIGAKTMYSFIKGSWSTTTFTLKDCTFDLTGSPNDGSTDLYVVGKQDGWNAANTTLNNVVINGKATSTPIRVVAGTKNFVIENCTFNNCKNVIATASAIDKDSSVKFANSSFINIGSFTSFEENIQYFKAAENNAWYDADDNALELSYDQSGSFKIVCDHSYSEATCTAPATCKYCALENGESKGGHIAGEAVRVEPDCVNAGSVTVSCTRCGEVLSTEKLHITEHDFHFVETIEPTCKQAGYHVYQCSTCNVKQTRSYYGDGKKTILAHTPDPTKEEVVAATCTTGGYNKHVCSVCGSTYYTDRHASRHTLVKDTVVLPTSDENGYTIYACSVDGCDYTVTRDLVAAGTAVDPDPTEPTNPTNPTEPTDPTKPTEPTTNPDPVVPTGDNLLTGGSWAVGQYGYSDGAVDTTGTYGLKRAYYTKIIDVEPGETYTFVLDTHQKYRYKLIVRAFDASGKFLGNLAGAHSSIGYADDLSPKYIPSKDVEIPENVAKIGISVHYVFDGSEGYNGGTIVNQIDNGTIDVGIYKVGAEHIHTPDLSKDKVVAPNCTYEGYTEHVCSVCGETYKDTYVDKDPDAHEIQTLPGKAATCTETGLTEGKYCELCRSMFVAQSEIPAKGHSGGTATCSNKAVCSVCNEEYGELDADNHGETEIRNAKAATCTEDGYSGDTYCKDCGEKIATVSTIEKTAHNLDEIAANPATHALPGNMAYFKCSVCGDCFLEKDGKTAVDEADTIIPKIDHEFSEYKHDEAKHWHECECGVIADEGEHSFGEWVIVTEPTEIATGIKERVCTVCEYKETEEIATVPPTVIYGDTNGDGKVNLLDLIVLRKHLAKWSVDIKLTAADCNADGKVNLMDLILLRKYLAKWDVKLGPQE